MIDFITEFLNSNVTDIETALGDQKEIVYAIIATTGFIIPLAYTCELFVRIITNMFRGGK